MTIADRKVSSTRRSWLGMLRAGPSSAPLSPSPITDKNASPAAESAFAHKPRLDMADLLIMSTVDQKAPPNLSGSADLLDALVQEHLEHGDAAPGVPNDMIAAPPPSPAAATVLAEPPAAAALPATLTADERAAMLQREIETLLRDAPADPAPAPDAAAAIAEAALQESPATAPIPVAAATRVPAKETAAPSSAKPAKDLSREELDVLLAEEGAAAVAQAVPGPVSAKNDQPLVSNAEAEQKLTEAEGVLADELAKLLEEAAPAETNKPTAHAPDPVPEKTPAAPPAPPAPAAEAAADTLNPNDAALTDELAKLMAAPMTEAAPATPTAPEPPAAPTPTAAASASSMASATAATAPAATPASGPVAAAAPASTTAPTTAQSQPSPAPATPTTQRPGFRQRVVAFFSGLMLTLAQLLDLPFAWMDDLSRNVIGVAAFMLLLGGVVLWALSRTALLGG